VGSVANRPSATGPGTVDRRINFYRAYVGQEDNGKPIPFEPIPILKMIDTLPFSADGTGRYLDDADTNGLCILSASGYESHPCTCFGAIRRIALPQVESKGRLTELEINDRDGLAEAIHVVFFPNNIIGAEYNHHGPRLSRLSQYLHEKGGPDTPVIRFDSLVRRDVAEQLNRLEDVRLFDLRILPAYIDVVRQADSSLAAAFDAARQLGNPKSLEIVIRLPNSGQGAFGRRLLDAARQIIGSTDSASAMERFQITGRREDTRRSETIDLLQNQIVAHKRVIRATPRGRALQSESVYEAIVSAYTENHEDIQQASTFQ